MNYIQNILEDGFDEVEFLSISMMPQRYFTISFEGIEKASISLDCLEFNMAIGILKRSFDNLYQELSQEYIFDRPQLMIKSDPCIFQLKVGIMHRDLYEEIRNSLDENKKANI